MIYLVTNQMLDSWKEFTLAHLVNFASRTSILLIFHHEVDYYYLYYVFGIWILVSLSMYAIPTRTSVLFNFLFGGGGLFVVINCFMVRATKQQKVKFIYYDVMKSLFEGKVMQKRGQSNQCMGQTLEKHSIRRDKVLPKKSIVIKKEETKSGGHRQRTSESAMHETRRTLIFYRVT
jgi:hypothetical protein